MTTLPEPKFYVECEGGEYQPFLSWPARKANPNPERVHAIIFEDGSVFDTRNGWRAGQRDELKHAQISSAL